VGGAAALVAQVHPTYGPAALQSFLEQNATDLGTPGPDDQTGAGALHLPATIPAAVDTAAPKARAIASSGRKGHVVRLFSRVFDDAGRLRIREQVKQGGRVLKTFTSAWIATPKAVTESVGWLAPVKVGTTLQHCVRAEDATGSVSPVTCARLTLR
jgi:hypothetical protein